MSAGDELTVGVVFRFGVRPLDEMFYADKRKPHVSDFAMGSDEAEAARNSGVGSLSVWNEELTTLDEARAFLSPERRLALWLSIESIRALPHQLQIISTPHELDLPGRDGHCDIRNMWSGDKETLRKIRSDLRDIARCDRTEI